MILAAINSAPVMGVIINCSKVPASFSRTIPAAGTSTPSNSTVMANMVSMMKWTYFNCGMYKIRTRFFTCGRKLCPAWPLRSTSGVAVGVPGTVKGVATALDRWGTISLGQALAPAIGIAENGFFVTSRLEGSLASKRLTSDPGAAAYEVARGVFFPDEIGRAHV